MAAAVGAPGEVDLVYTVVENDQSFIRNIEIRSKPGTCVDVLVPCRPD